VSVASCAHAAGLHSPQRAALIAWNEFDDLRPADLQTSNGCANIWKSGEIPAIHRNLKMEELLDAFLGLHDALSELELADRFPDLPVDYRRLVCQLRVVTNKGIEGIEDA